MKKKINLAVIFGGKSKEHEISLSSALGVTKELDKNKYNIIPIAITKKGSWLIGEKGKKYIKLNAASAGKENAISEKKSQELVKAGDKENTLTKNKGKIDLVLPILHGPFGEDGKIQGMLDTIGIPYVFSGVLAHALGMNKQKSKIIVQNAGVPVAKDLIFKKIDKINTNFIIKKIDLPVMVKPNELGSSVGISIIKEEKNLKKAIEDTFKLGEEVLIEQYIKGREFTVAVIGNQSLKTFPIIEIIPVISDFYDYKAKYEDGGSKHICPAKISKKLTEKVQDYAVKIFKAIGCHDLARMDFIFNPINKEFYFIDINTIPGMTPTSLVPDAAKQIGISYSKFLDKIIEGALKRK